MLTRNPNFFKASPNRSVIAIERCWPPVHPIKTVDEAVTKALIELETTSDKLEYEVVDKGTTGFLGIGAKPAIIRAKKKESIEDKAMDFLSQIFGAMNMQVNITAAYNQEEQELSLNLEGEDMGILIGKRGQTPVIIPLV